MEKKKKQLDDLVFRCHELGKLMVGVKPNLTEKQYELYEEILRLKELGAATEKQLEKLDLLEEKKNKPAELSKSVRTHLENRYRSWLFERKKTIQSKYLTKGIWVEEFSISLYSDVKGFPYIKNSERFTNDYISGEPDCLTKDVVRDIKSSWSWETFPMQEEEIPNNDYWWQLQGYMMLTGRKKAELIYCLVDTPQMLIDQEIKREMYACGIDPRQNQEKEPYTEEQEKDIENIINEVSYNHTYSEIDSRLRVKVFSFEYDEGAIMKLVNQIEACREYLAELHDKTLKILGYGAE